MRWNYSFISKLQWCSCWILGMDKQFQFTFTVHVIIHPCYMLVKGAPQTIMNNRLLITSCPNHFWCLFYQHSLPEIRGHFKNAHELLNLRALKILKLYKNHIFQCMGKIFCVEFQRVPLKFHTKYLTHTLKDEHFITGALRFKSSWVFLKGPPGPG